MSPLATYRERILSLDELVEASETLLRAAGVSTTDERVSPFPDRRTIRYYQSLGVLDRPLGYEGRQASYGYRHLLQAVATKLLQAQGQRLAQVQRALAGLDTARLEAAVSSSLNTKSAAPAAPPPSLPSSPVTASPLRSWVAVEVAPGIVVTIDPALVPDPQAVLARIADTLTP